MAKTIKASTLREFIIKRVKASLQEIKSLEEMYEMETLKGVGSPEKVNPQALGLVAKATRLVTHDDPNAVGRFYQLSRSMKRNKDDKSMYATPEEFYTELADYFLDMATNEEGVSDNDGETPRLTPDVFQNVDRVELGKAVEQHFSK